MYPLIKLILFFIILAVVALMAFGCYKKINYKITGSETIAALIFYSLMLIVVNVIILFGGVFVLIRIFDLLSPAVR